MGNIAAAEGALAAGCRFFGGYPITPSSEIMEHMAKVLPGKGGVFMQMEDELGSIAAVVGASWAGAKAMTATSGPGFSLMQETIGYAAITETPCVIIDVQRAGPATGQATRPGSGDIIQAKHGSHGDYEIIALAPSSVQEMYDLTIRAFNLSEKFRVPTFVMTDEGIGHLREGAVLHKDFETINRRKEPGTMPFDTDDPLFVPPMPIFGDGENLLVTGSTHDGWGYRKVEQPEVHERLVKRLRQKILDHRDEIIETSEDFTKDAELLVIAYGFVARSARKAVKVLREKGYKAGLLRLKTLWPFPKDIVARLTSVAHKVIVPEMNYGQVAGEVAKVSKSEVIPYCRVNGEVISSIELIRELERHVS
ncbi:MAG: 2-oxoacid:acceptor oxidoreductase subunit alpha [Deltaproteobacteria bacterium]|nr:2-oxoacid:acceptor oxidoreductase subunit alpha [Deltaproteobacteria bacterium]